MQFLPYLANIIAICILVFAIYLPRHHRRDLAVAYLGGHVEYEVETEIGTLFIIDHMAETGLPPASDVTLGFRSRGIALIQA